jgi:hypothetical protein
MPFTKEEFETWHRAKLEGEFQHSPDFRESPAATCSHCGHPIGHGGGMITEDFALCDACDGD